MLTVQLIGGDRVVARLQALPPKVMGLSKTEVSRLAIELLRIVKEQKLSGQVLRNQSGTLRRKVNQQVIADDRAVVGKVGVKLSYAAAHEYGVDKQVTVRAHLREIKKAWGRSIDPRKIQVGEHSRHMKLPERSFLRSALRELEPAIAKGLEAAVRKAVQQ